MTRTLTPLTRDDVHEIITRLVANDALTVPMGQRMLDAYRLVDAPATPSQIPTDPKLGVGPSEGVREARRVFWAARPEDKDAALDTLIAAVRAEHAGTGEGTRCKSLGVMALLADWRSYWHTAYSDDLTLTGKQADELCTLLNVPFESARAATPTETPNA